MFIFQRLYEIIQKGMFMKHRILKYLGTVEGTELHRNSTESDITTPYGIYREEHPTASIFNYIDTVASENGFDSPSSEWGKEEIVIINELLDNDTVENLVIEFYDNFYKNLHSDLFSDKTVLAAFSLYTNSPKLLWKSVQASINKFHTNGFINYKIQSVDGAYGNSTSNGIKLVNDAIKLNDIYDYVFESYIISNMQKEYAKLVVMNPDKYIKYLNGWNNRVTALLES